MGEGEAIPPGDRIDAKTQAIRGTARVLRLLPGVQLRMSADSGKQAQITRERGRWREGEGAVRERGSGEGGRGRAGCRAGGAMAGRWRGGSEEGVGRADGEEGRGHGVVPLQPGRAGSGAMWVGPSGVILLSITRRQPGRQFPTNPHHTQNRRRSLLVHFVFKESLLCTGYMGVGVLTAFGAVLSSVTN